ncbi:hypothetical protein M378DRAFT_165648, partial [Amanita muscaria Koide BX008]
MESPSGCQMLLFFSPVRSVSTPLLSIFGCFCTAAKKQNPRQTEFGARLPESLSCKRTGTLAHRFQSPFDLPL